MIVFVNKSTNKIDNNGLNVIPIELNTDIIIETIKKTESDQKIDDDGNLIYIDSNDNETTDSWEIDKITSSFEPFDFTQNKINLLCGKTTDIDEDIKYANINDTTPVLNTVNYLENVKIDKDNVEDYSIDYLMEKEITNLLENSNYEYSIYNILENIIYSNSSFYNKNNFNVLLDKDDNLYINITDIDTTSRIELEIYGIDKNATVFVNECQCTLNSNGAYYVYIDDILMDNLKIEILNKSENIIKITNPYILFNY